MPTPDDLLAGPPLEAAVAALAERNHHHLAQMNDAERDVPGRAVIVLEDSGPEEIAIHATFFPQLQDLGGGEVGATPAQAAALELLEQISDDDPGAP